MSTKRKPLWYGKAIGILIGLAGLVACQETPQGPPLIPYGQALDVTQAGTFVAFEFRIDKPDRYDVVLEVFKKDNTERIPREVWDTPNAHFKVHLQSLAPGGGVLVDEEVKKAQGGLEGRTLGRSRSETTDLMSFTNYLIEEHPMAAGAYRIRVENVNPIPALQGRLVNVTVLPKVYRK
jgi:hypothetical protein